MDSLVDDYPTDILLAHEPPRISLYQPTHRHHPENQQDPIRFRNLVKALEESLRQKYPTRETRPLLEPFEALADDRGVLEPDPRWTGGARRAGHVPGLSTAAAGGELAVVADSFHTKPLRASSSRPTATRSSA